MSGSTAIGGDIYNSAPFDPAQPPADLPTWLLAAAVVGVVMVALIVTKR